MQRTDQAGGVWLALLAIGGCATVDSIEPGTATAARPRAIAPSHERQAAEQARLVHEANGLRAGGQYEAAEALYTRALTIAQEADGPDSPAVAGVLREYAALLRLAGDVEDAASMDARAQQIIDSARAPAAAPPRP